MDYNVGSHWQNSRVPGKTMVHSKQYGLENKKNEISEVFVWHVALYMKGIV